MFSTLEAHISVANIELAQKNVNIFLTGVVLLVGSNLQID